MAGGLALSSWEASKDGQGQADMPCTPRGGGCSPGALPRGEIAIARSRKTRLSSQVNQSLLVRTLRATSIAAITQVHIDTSYALGRQMLEFAGPSETANAKPMPTSNRRAAARVFHVEEAQGHYRQAEELYSMLGNRRDRRRCW